MEIKVYMRPTCTWCQKLKEWLKKKKCSFQELDIVESDTYRDELIVKTGQLAVPVIEIDGQLIIGFNEKVMESIIAKAKGK